MTPRTDIKEALSTDEEYLLDDLGDFGGDIEDDDSPVGQLSIDVYQTTKDVILKAPIAGVKPDNLDIMVTDELVSIRGSREETKEVQEDRYLIKECFWGSFARSVTLPVLVVPDEADASFKDGILTIKIPKASQSKMRKLKVKTS